MELNHSRKGSQKQKCDLYELFGRNVYYFIVKLSSLFFWGHMLVNQTTNTFYAFGHMPRASCFYYMLFLWLGGTHKQTETEWNAFSLSFSIVFFFLKLIDLNRHIACKNWTMVWTIGLDDMAKKIITIKFFIQVSFNYYHDICQISHTLF